jgi:DNA ligase-1
MKIVDVNDVRQWVMNSSDLAVFAQRIGVRDPEAWARANYLPIHLQFIIEQRAKETAGPVDTNAFNSISFYSLCQGLFLPLSGLSRERAAQIFGVLYNIPNDGRDKLVRRFLNVDIGLDLVQKMSCLLGDPFRGRRGTFRRDSLVRLLRSMVLTSRTNILDRLTVVGDVAVLFAENTEELKSDPPLTALEVLETLRFLPKQKLLQKYEVLRSLFRRCGKLEAYFLVKLIMRAAGFGFEYQGPLLAQMLAERFKVSQGQIEHAMALTDPLFVTDVLAKEGAEGLRKIEMKPLSPIRPALAGGAVDDIAAYPIWVERKYDGIRLLLHKSTDSRGSVLCGAYTRNRGDWLELIPGMSRTIPYLPAANAIIDGELHGTLFGVDGVRQSTVYDVVTAIQGETSRPIQLKYAAFDLLYLNGQDLTRHPLSYRRQVLSMLLQPLQGMPLPIPITLAEGLMAESREDLNRLFHHFRNQGYEGIIAKDLNSPYLLASRDKSWVKRKPEITLDLVLLGGVLAVTSKEVAGTFGSYVIGAKNDKGGFDIVGDVAGVDKVRDMQIQSEIMQKGLLTGRRIERPSASGVRPGYEFAPSIVVTVKFEGITNDKKEGRLSLRDPKIALIRSDKSAFEADDVLSIEKLYMDQTLS